MRKIGVVALAPIFVALAAIRVPPVQTQDAQRVIALERAALDRWGRGDPNGYLENYAPEITYFDPFQERRIDGRVAMEKMLEPIRGKVNVPSYEMIAPKVQQHGDVAVLTYNLVSQGRAPNGDTV